MADHRLVRTERLALAAVTEADLADLDALSAETSEAPLPSGRQLESPTRRSADFAAAWQRDGLGYWTARLHSTGAFVGVGGCAVRHDEIWNVYYRFRPEAWGTGLAGELIGAARAAAAAVDARRPVVAYLVEQNVASRRVAERAGLQLVWRGPDLENPDPSVVRLVFADRELTPRQLELMTEHR